MLSRRGFLGSLIALIAAPAIVCVTSIMPVKAMPTEKVLATLQGYHQMGYFMGNYYVPIEAIKKNPLLFNELCDLYENPLGYPTHDTKQPRFFEDFSLDKEGTKKFEGYV